MSKIFGFFANPTARTRRTLLVLSSIILISTPMVLSVLKKHAFAEWNFFAYFGALLVSLILFLYMFLKEWRDFPKSSGSTNGIISIPRNKAAASQVFLDPKDELVIRLFGFFDKDTGISQFSESDLGYSIKEAKSELFKITRNHIKRDKKKAKKAISVIKSALCILAYCRSNEDYAHLKSLADKAFENETVDESILNEGILLSTKFAEEALQKSDLWTDELQQLVKYEMI